MKQSLYTIAAGIVALASFTSCEKYLNVQPKSQVLADEFFVDDQSFKDCLVGVYEKMTGTSLYGREMTYGLVSVLGQDYDIASTNTYYEASQYHYLSDAPTRSRIDAIWSEQYNCIANLNLMLQYIDEPSRSVFEDDNYYLYKGEAIGLRAFLHFDLMRLFAPAATSSTSASAVPYVTTYGTEVTPQKSTSETLAMIKNDLKTARELLRQGDKLYKQQGDSAYYYRGAHMGFYGQQIFNYYAATATLARVYQWENKMDSAYVYANEIVQSIEANEYKFSWTHQTAVAASNLYDRDFIFSSEHIFRLGMNKMEDEVKNWFTATAVAANNLLTPSEAMLDQLFEVTSKGYGMDNRRAYGYIYDGGTYPYIAKYKQVEGSSYANMIPLIRISEMYYICAEAKAKSDKALACTLLNTVRNQRNISAANDLDATVLSSDDIISEIEKEYRKEMIAEGQTFYYYKRNGYSFVPGSAGVTDYVLPYPDNEKEFGGRK